MGIIITNKVALYARVSTDDKGQSNETQLLHLRKIAEAQGYEIVREYTDESSGKTVKGRTGYQSMMKDAATHRFDAIMGYKLDRFHRNLSECISFVNSLNLMGVDLIVTSQAIDTTTAMGRAMMQITVVFAELESANTSERVKIGLERAKAEGKLCHPEQKTLSDYQIEKAKRILAENPDISLRALTKEFSGISRPTLTRELRRLNLLPGGKDAGSLETYKETPEKKGGKNTPPNLPIL